MTASLFCTCCFSVAAWLNYASTFLPEILLPFTTRDVYQLRLLLFVGCLSSQLHACVSQARICLDNCVCCHTEIEVADQTFYHTQSAYTRTGATSPIADPVTPGAWQVSHWSTNFQVTGMIGPRQRSTPKAGLQVSRWTPYHWPKEVVY